ncbi:MAG: c-type cytochrome [Polyangia bacterium]
MRKVLIIASLLSFALSASADENDPRVKRAWKAKCASCHGEDGKGDTEQARKKFGGPLRDLTDPKVQESFKDADLKDSITKGKTVQKDGKELKMPATPEIAGEQLDGLVMFVRKLAKK